MKNIYILILVFIQVVLYSSCLTTQDTNLLRDPGGKIPNYPKVEAIGEYKIKRGDELQIYINSMPGDKTEQLFSLFSPRGGMTANDELKLNTFTVDLDGNIYFPYLGKIDVGNKTTLEIQEILKKKITEQLTEDCIVNVYLANRYFSVIGESRVGRYPIAKEQTTIYQALAQSRDINPYGDRAKVKIIRQTEHGSIIKIFDVRSSDIINSEFYYIQPNDVIYIQPLEKQFLGFDSFGAVFAVLASVASLGLLIYSLVK